MRKTVRNRVLWAAVCAALVMFAGCGGEDDSESSSGQSESQKPVTTYTVTFFPNPPAGVEGAEKLVEVSWTRFANDELRLPMGLFSLDGYHIVRWVDTVTGSSWGTDDRFVVLENTSFYAVWEKDAIWQTTIDGISYYHYLDDEGNDYWVAGGAVQEITEANIKSEIDGIPVTRISEYGFYNRDNLTSVTIPDSVTDIGKDAFCSCDNLVTVAIPDSITTIGECAFGWCDSLKNITIPNSVTSIGDTAFAYCKSLTSITIPDGVTNIGSSAFTWCDSLESITIASSVTSIGYYAFAYCESLASIEIPDGVTSIGEQAFENCGSLETITIPNSVTSIEDRAFAGCKSLTNVVIPDGVTGIGECTFTGCNNLEHITIGEGVTSIGDYAFNSCNSLISVIIPDSVTSIGDSAFAYCKSLEGVTIGDGVTSIGESAFGNCQVLTSIEIPYNVTSIGKNAFAGCSWLKGITVHGDNPSYSSQDGILYNKDKTELICVPQRISGAITIPDGVMVIRGRAFEACLYLTSVEIPDTVTTIGEYAFARCYFRNIVIPDSVTSIGEGAFVNSWFLTEITLPFVGASKDGTVNTCLGYIFGGIDNTSVPQSLTSVIIHGDTTSIGSYAFSGCGNLTSVTIGDGVTSIEYNAFSGCDSLTSIEIPDSVTSIGSKAFSGCNSLTNVTIGGGLTNIGYDAFGDCGRLKSITINDSNPNYSSQGGIIYDKNKTEIIYVLKAISGSVTIPNSVTSIKSSAFNGCNSLTNIEIPDSVTSIGKNAFSDCRNLASITIDDGNPRYSSQDGIIYNKNKTEIIYVLQAISGAVAIPNGIGSIGSEFSGCSRLESIVIPNSVTSIEKGAFSGCSSLRKIAVPFVGTSKWGTSNNYLGYIFGGTDNSSVPRSLTVIILDGITSIGKNAFSGCSGLVSVTIPDSVTSIENGAFSGCSNLTEMTLPFAGATKDGTDNTYFDYIFGGTTSYSGSSSYNSLVPSSLKKVTVTGSVGDYAFYRCKGLTSVTIGTRASSIGTYAFYGCNGITSLTIENGVSNIGTYAFRDCKGLTSLILPSSVMFIGERAFNMCTGLTTVTMSNSLQLIDDLAFGGCMALMNIVFKGTPEQWDAIEKATYWDYSTGGVEGYWYGHKFYTVTYEY